MTDIGKHNTEIEQDEMENLLRMDPVRSSLDVESRAIEPDNIAGESIVETRFTGGDSLDEPIRVTLFNEFRAIGEKLVYVLYPKNAQVLRDWDLWGPLIFSLVIALALALSTDKIERESVFTVVVALIWFGEAVCSLNIKLLGANISIFQSMCILGYSSFPLMIASIVCAFVPLIFIRIPVIVAMYAWTLFAAMGVLQNSNLSNKKLLAVYPLFLFYFSLAWIIFL
ncbi:Protein YIP4 [Schizosaccharomyces pombe]|uniref:Protein YIP4 n=1 Tax=Schizosaccharomyces pombe (strain 972 / ATCC 24843) TaxID=284812 RepID=YIP4_SCHPO|nr:putative Rab GTPase-binding protein [Schizosaccharomyces pombe]Q9P6P8.1 RecName: Full=Protein YIP4; AltName: Full=YPT-interacting protein 4 [Schizosaccharomyces pombe 972h-]CAB90140.1 Rab GTPase binding (predicted) [Schizosaccharomyces pombe]|eukprot:NP_593881.1 putative Rab GTPase-binding protein [Schizosaccharomyces pombe]